MINFLTFLLLFFSTYCHALRDRTDLTFTVIEEKNGLDFEDFSEGSMIYTAKEKSSIDESIFPPRTVKVNSVRPLIFEHAKTADEKTWGLMGRKELSEDEGMIFHYHPPQRVSIWMFNCLIDLDVAFLDSSGTIKEIHTLKAYPEKMDPSRPIRSIQDLKKYPPWDPIVQFFTQKRVRSTTPVSYVVEMRAGWFKDHEIGIGDTIEIY